MKKSIVHDNVFFVIEWSEFFAYDRITAGRILPDMPGILHICDPTGAKRTDLLLFASWREGLRSGLKNLMDPLFSSFPAIREDFSERNIEYRYTVIDSSPQDMQDIFFWLIKSYRPQYNNADGYEDSKRYVEISVNEVAMGKAALVPGFKS